MRVQTIAFGKHRGTPVSEVPEDYLSWLIDSSRASIKMAEDELERRRLASEATLGMAEQIIKAGYRALSMKFHPDHEGGDSEKMKQLNNDKERLSVLLREHLEDD